jgi:uncharacterized protein YbaR (Trm112 family)
MMPAVKLLRDALGYAGETHRLFVARRAANERHTPRPPSTGLVLDVGAGHEPIARADLVVDKYIADDFERERGLSFAKPVVVADGHALPLADDAFSYVIAAHVLEHATDPVQFADELSRVGRSGFVQVPSREAELTFGWPFHPWLIDRSAETLQFHPRGHHAAVAGTWFHIQAATPVFGLWYGAHRDVWHHTIHWIGGFKVDVIAESRAPQTATFDIERSRAVATAADTKPLTAALRALLRCPADKQPLADDTGALRCTVCDRSYPVVNHVPLLIGEAAD